MRTPKSGGGWQAIRYTWRKGRQVGLLNLWNAMRSKNACKTCALGMGGQLGGMTNEERRFPEVCKKSLQAMVADMQGRIDPKFFETYSVEQLQGFTPRELEALGRLTDPVIRQPGSTHFKTITWDEAIDHLAAKLNTTDPARTFFYSSGRSSNEAGFLMQLFARAYGTNHVNNCSYYCHQASGVGLKDSIGTGTATVTLEDLDKSDLVFLIGGNPASNHPRLMTSLMRLKERGGKVIVVNPLKETGLVNFKVPSSPKSMLFGTAIASLYIQPTIGGDIAFLAGLAKSLLERDRLDRAFIDDFTEDFQTLERFLQELTWEEIEQGSGVAKSRIEEAANLYFASEKTVFAWTMGITHHEHGVQNVQWIVNLALLRGMVGKEGAGLMPIRGHSNVQGLGSIGVTPQLSAAVLARMTELGMPMPGFEGYDTMAALEAAERGEMDFAFCLGGNLFGASPDAGFASSSLGNIDTVVYLSTTMNTGHVHGLGKATLILPVLARDEEHQSTTQESMFNYVRLSDGGITRHSGPRAETDIIAAIAAQTKMEAAPAKTSATDPEVAPEQSTEREDAAAQPKQGARYHLDWQKLSDHNEIRNLIAQLIPGFGGLATIGETKEEFHIPGRIIHEPKFPTVTGKARFHAHALPCLAKLEPNQLRLMTVRSEGQFNTVVYEEEDIYRGQERRDVILMNPIDITRLDLQTDQPVDVYNEVGRMNAILVRPFDIAQGCAVMYYPEANALVPRTVDPRSKTPAFKSAVVTISPSTSRVETAPVTFHTDSSTKDQMRAC